MDSAKNLCKDVKNAKPISLDVENSEALDAEVGKVDGKFLTVADGNELC